MCCSCYTYRWLKKRTTAKFAQFTIDRAVMYDAHLRVIKYLVRDCGCQLDSQLFAMAVHHGELRTARWMLQQNRAFKYRHSVADAAAASGNTALVDWLKEEEGVVFTATAMAYGAVHSSANKLATVQMLRSRRVPWSEEVFSAAISGSGSVELVEYLLRAGCPHDSDWSVYIELAAKSHHTSVLQWLLLQPATAATTADMLQQNGAEYVHGAVHMCHLDMLKFLHQYGCPFSADLCTVGLKAGNVEVLKWLLEQGLVLVNSAAAVEAAVGSTSVELLQWLKQELDFSFGAAAVQYVNAHTYSKLRDFIQAEVNAEVAAV
jgi:hypothetical protein